MKVRVLAALAIVAVVSTGCLESTINEPHCRRITSVPLETRGDTVVTSTGLRYIQVQPGTGAQAVSCATVDILYVGQLTNGFIFDQTRGDTTRTFGLGITPLVTGFEEGLLGMQEGGSRRLIIPPALGYGASPPPNSGIPANATLIFDIRLVNVRR
jgi:FKBP-type peptidyl-prolyl cis-trans isomerase